MIKFPNWVIEWSNIILTYIYGFENKLSFLWSVLHFFWRFWQLKVTVQSNDPERVGSSKPGSKWDLSLILTKPLQSNEEDSRQVSRSICRQRTAWFWQTKKRKKESFGCFEIQESEWMNVVVQKNVHKTNFFLFHCY